MPQGIENTAKSSAERDQMEVAREVMARRHRALMTLADAIMDEDREILKAPAK